MTRGEDRLPAAPAWLPALARVALLATRAFCRIEVHGALPRRDGPLLILANHQHDLDSIAVPLLAVLTPPTRTPVRAVGSQRLFEPGLLGPRLPDLFASALPGLNPGRALRRLGVLPLENEPLRRPLASLAYEVYLRHGDLPLREVLAAGGPGRVSDIWVPGRLARHPAPASILDLREPYRGEARAALRPRVEAQMAAVAAALAGGATVFVTPEGRVTADGRLAPMGGLLSRLLPLARGRIQLAAIAYDPLVRRRFTMVVRLLAPADPDDIATSLAAARPVTASQLLSVWLVRERPKVVTPAGIEAALREGVRALPAGAWVAPVPAAARGMLATLVRLGYCAPGGAMTGRVHDRRLHEPLDVFAAQAAMLDETCQALRRLRR